MVLLRRATGPTAGGQSGTETEEQQMQQRYLGQLSAKPPSEEMSPAQGIEQLSAMEARQLFGQLRAELKSAQGMQGNNADESDKDWFLDEWMGSALDAPGTSHMTLTLNIDRPVVVYSVIASLATSATSGWLYIGSRPLQQFQAVTSQGLANERVIPINPTNPLVLQGLQMIIMPGDSFQIVSQPNPTDPTGMFVEVMGAYMRNSVWRRF